MTEQMARRKIATDFYQRFFPGNMDQIEFIDFNHPVREVRIEKGTRLWGFKDPRISPFKTTFFCIPGTPREKLGVHGAGNLKTNPKALDKVLNQYEVLVAIPQALESVCADGLDAWSEKGRVHPVTGGGWQYKVPDPPRYVRYTTPFPNSTRA
jgi:Bacterial toxin 46